jgi:membrane protease YdiL (CAAX protease family)
MRTWIRSLSTRGEVLVVCAVAFGSALVRVALALAGVGAAPAITQSQIYRLVTVEPLILGLLGGFLYLRGWTLRRIGLVPVGKDLFVGLALGIAAYVAYLLLWYLCWLAQVRVTYLAGSTQLVVGGFTLLSVLAVSILNPLYEEVFVCGYLVTVGGESGRLAAGMNASIGLRLAYHLYQGGAGVIGVLPFGFLAAWWFSRTRRLWPPIVAHAIMDFVSLARHVGT